MIARFLETVCHRHQHYAAYGRFQSMRRVGNDEQVTCGAVPGGVPGSEPDPSV